MIKPGYKMTDIGEIPEEWDADKISTLKKSMYYGVTASATEENTNLRFLRTTDITNYKFTQNELPFCKITEKRSDLSKYYLKKNDIVVARAGTVGVSVLVKEDLKDTLFGSYLIKITLNQEKVNMSFVHYYFQSRLYWNKISSAQGSTIKNINLPFLGSLVIPVPPLQEQQKIAEILTTADGKIDVIDKKIDAAERLKKGLMQTLLTIGIGHTKFKMTEIGEIPEEWAVKNLGDKEVSIIKMGQSPSSATYNKTGNGLPFLQGNAEFRFKYPSTSTYCSSPLKTASLGDILISVRAPVGDVNVANSEYCIGRGLTAIQPNQKSIDSSFLYYMLNHLRPSFERVSTGSTFKAIGKEQLHFQRIPFPPLLEQQKIAEILTTADRKIELLNKKRGEAERLKKGLMQILLTGQVRVKTDSPRGEN